MKKYSLELAVFLCGACLMILELVGSRLLSPYIGTSLIVWTTLIGVVMAFLSLGYWYGGRLADKKTELKTLSFIIFFAAISVFLIIVFNSFFLKNIQLFFSDIRVGAIIASLVLFSLPSFLLGIVSPYAARLKMLSLDSSGRTIGDLYALSTIGSIIGTFAAGFWLIPFLGTIRILYLIAIILLAASLLVYLERFSKTRVFLAILLVLGMFFSLWQSRRSDFGTLIDFDTQYSRIWISTATTANGRPVLNLKNDPYAVQSGMFLDKDDDLVSRYSKYYRLADFFNREIKQGLVIGAAAYSYPKDFLKKHGQANLDVVEIDPGMTWAAEKYFNLPKNDRLSIFHADGRVFLNLNRKKYDAVYLDAFNSRLSIPYQLTTVEAVGKVEEAMSDDGVVIVNIISAIKGDKSKFLRAEYATYKKIFPQLFLFQVDRLDPYRTQNLILVGLKKEWKKDLRADSAELKGYLDMQWRQPLELDLPVLTDDYAPVDYYAMNLF